MSAGEAFSLRPNHKKKFRAPVVKEIIKKVLQEKLDGQDYHADNVTNYTKEIADLIRDRLKDLGWDRYKYVVQCVVGEQRGEGLKMGCRCFWDSDTDNYAEEMYISKTCFCVATVFGIYHY
eukprot:NODE_7275_length_451_cov_7.765432_g7109_i0.p2 GENE.NODE_7275_length_451_cov_7.765432_g7109_i0~~NODE_7275_length_451_cov_7.765432_g7109_i0.p2  ORF type:complete len:133 (+),score=49.14 NODE_7275_length_451_cov_7.765432_g7109_i0:37-399(+)